MPRFVSASPSPRTTTSGADEPAVAPRAAAADRPGHDPHSGATRCPDCSDGLGRPRTVRPGAWRERLHRNPLLSRVWRVAVFVAGLLLIAVGIALAVLPGPLTIPPVLLGLWVWSTEFDWARRLFTTFLRKAREAGAHARQHPVSSTVVTVGGLVAVAAVVWAVRHYDLVDRLKDVVGIT